MSKTVLVTGGSGYIGTQVCVDLVAHGYNVVNIDHKKKDIEGVTQYPFDIDNHQTKGILQLVKPDVIIHLAAYHSVPESFDNPGAYYYNNVANTINLLNSAVEAGCKQFIFSSSSTVYNPVSPYGRSKRMVEEIMCDFQDAYDIRCLSLRYFNAAGAAPDMKHGYTESPARHLIPIVCRSVFS